MVDTKKTPGGHLPGSKTPGADTPDADVPDPSIVDTERVQATGVPVDATGTTTIGTPNAHGVVILAVLVDATAADFDFNIEYNATDIFSAEQSPSGTSEERFVPDVEEAREDHGVANQLVIDVSAASATGGATADVTVVVGRIYPQG